MLTVICGIIFHNNKVLVCRRSAQMKLPLKWEFPGGKLENNETEEQCLIREIKEELQLNIIVKNRITPVHFSYPTFQINLIPYICLASTTTVVALEHQQTKWVSVEELDLFDFAAADIPIVQEIKTLLF